MTTQTDPVAHWTATITDLEQRIAQAEAAVQTAKDLAAEVVLAGQTGEKQARDITIARDHVDTLRAALGAARRHLAAAQDTVAQRQRAAALERAQKAARRRLDAARELDEYFSALDALVGTYIETGAEMARAMTEAGLRAPSGESMSGGYRLRAALAFHAPLTTTKLDVPRVDQAHRDSLRHATAAQVRPLMRERIDG
jgi:hypothetical protein